MKLSVWAKKNGLTYKTAWRLFRDGNMPVPTTRLKTGTVLVHEPVVGGMPERAVLYARVSSHDQKADAERQLGRLRDFASARGLSVHAEFLEIGSGLNGRRKQIVKILTDPTVTSIVVEHRDRLARFGVELISAVLESHGRRIIVMNEVESKDDLAQDMADVLTSLCARLYGKRGAANRAKRALEATKKP